MGCMPRLCTPKGADIPRRAAHLQEEQTSPLECINRDLALVYYLDVKSEHVPSESEPQTHA